MQSKCDRAQVQHYQHAGFTRELCYHDKAAIITTNQLFISTKLELIRIIAHLTAGIFIAAENSETGSEGLYLLLSSH